MFGVLTKDLVRRFDAYRDENVISLWRGIEAADERVPFLYCFSSKLRTT